MIRVGSSVEAPCLREYLWSDKTRRTDQANNLRARLQIPTGTRDETRRPRVTMRMWVWRKSHAVVPGARGTRAEERDCVLSCWREVR